MALVREYPVNSVIAQRSAAEAVDVSVVSASATGEQSAAPDRRQAQSRIVEALLRRCIFTKTAAKSLLSGIRRIPGDFEAKIALLTCLSNGISPRHRQQAIEARG